jgi:hypothetical protein
MAAVNYATEFKQALSQAFKATLRTEGFWNRGFKYISSKVIALPTVSAIGFKPRDLDSITAFSRNVDISYVTKTLSHQRIFDTTIDPADVMGTNMTLTIANASQVFVTEQKIPEMDAFFVSKLFAEKTASPTAADISTTVLTNVNVLDEFDKFNQTMTGNDVPIAGRVAFMSAETLTLLKQALTTNRRLMSTEVILNRTIETLDGVELRVIPNARFKTVYDFTTGFVPGVGAKDIRILMVHIDAVSSPLVIDSVFVSEPSAVTKGNHLLVITSDWDTFINPNRDVAVQINHVA